MVSDRVRTYSPVVLFFFFARVNLLLVQHLSFLSGLNPETTRKMTLFCPPKSIACDYSCPCIVPLQMILQTLVKSFLILFPPIFPFRSSPPPGGTIDFSFSGLAQAPHPLAITVILGGSFFFLEKIYFSYSTHDFSTLGPPSSPAG